MSKTKKKAHKTYTPRKSINQPLLSKLLKTDESFVESATKNAIKTMSIDKSMVKKALVSISLMKIQQELTKLNLWSNGENRPSDEAFLSTTPFCIDTMEFHQWLEFVLIPRMKEILQNDEMPLPRDVKIHTFAQENYRGKWQEYKELIQSLIEFDKIFVE